MQARYCQNTNRLIQPDDPYYDPTCTGIKTGHTAKAGYCLISSACENGKNVIAVVMGSNEDNVWSDAKSLLKYGLSRE